MAKTTIDDRRRPPCIPVPGTAPKSSGVRWGIAAFIAAITGAALYVLGMQLLVDVYCDRAQVASQQGYFGLAAQYLKEAARLNPNSFRVRKAQGEVLFELAGRKFRRSEAITLNLEAARFFGAAQRLNPLDADTAYRLARVAARLEARQLANERPAFPGPSNNAFPGRAKFYFDEAIRLRPNGISYRYAFTNHFDRLKNGARLKESIRELCRIYPRSFYHLRKEAYWTADLAKAAEEGLTVAVAAGTDRRDALTALAHIKEQAGEWLGALVLFRQALNTGSRYIKASEYTHLSSLYMQVGNEKGARQAFFSAVQRSRDRYRGLEYLFSRYRSAGFQQAYVRFYLDAGRKLVLPHKADILAARAMIDLNRYAEAREVLENVNDRAPLAEAYYWLAIIARNTQNWDAMELDAQRATVYAPENGRNRRLFALALQKQGKFSSAEKQADLALKYYPEPSPWIFNQRAWIRWHLENFVGAIRDWRRAARLRPDVPAFYAQIGEGYHQLGDQPRAVQNYTKAIRLSPENKHYQRRLMQLVQKQSLNRSET